MNARCAACRAAWREVPIAPSAVKRGAKGASKLGAAALRASRFPSVVEFSARPSVTPPAMVANVGIRPPVTTPPPPSSPIDNMRPGVPESGIGSFKTVWPIFAKSRYSCVALGPRALTALHNPAGVISARAPAGRVRSFSKVLKLLYCWLVF